jgi:hypothetical protein
MNPLLSGVDNVSHQLVLEIIRLASGASVFENSKELRCKPDAVKAFYEAH